MSMTIAMEKFSIFVTTAVGKKWFQYIRDNSCGKNGFKVYDNAHGTKKRFQYLVAWVKCFNTFSNSREKIVSISVSKAVEKKKSISVTIAEEKQGPCSSSILKNVLCLVLDFSIFSNI